MREATSGEKEAGGGFATYGSDPPRSPVRPELTASCGHGDPGAQVPRPRPSRPAAKALGQSPLVGRMDPHPKFSSEVEASDATGAPAAGEGSFVPRLSEESRAGSLAGRIAARSGEGAGWGLTARGTGVGGGPRLGAGACTLSASRAQGRSPKGQWVGRMGGRGGCHSRSPGTAPRPAGSEEPTPLPGFRPNDSLPAVCS